MKSEEYQARRKLDIGRKKECKNDNSEKYQKKRPLKTIGEGRKRRRIKRSVLGRGGKPF